MGKSTFTFDTNEERTEIQDIINIPEYKSALYELQKLRREIYKYYIPESATVCIQNGNKVLTQEDYIKSANENKIIENTKTYISAEYIEQRLDDILEDVNKLID